MDVVEDVSKKLEIDDRKVINKASEHLRLLNIKSSSLQLTEYAKTVICLDIAATNTNSPFNQETALALLCYGKARYRKEKNIIQRVLNVTQVPDVRSICSMVRVANQKELEERATKMLKEYRATTDLTDSHPQYDAMAVYHTSKMMKLKVNEDKLIDVSHLKRMQWSHLKTKWQRWLDVNKIKLTDPTKKRNADKVDAGTVDDTKENVMPKVKCIEATESYDDWKKRILAKAYAELKTG
ncbi:hypothetical protein HA402_006057 [Bradysia odoriphaga]|nr:hypothetical protein HA402_006057 [Bradysia odoriphaga]